MTRKLEELFDLPHSEDVTVDTVLSEPPIITTETLDKIDKIEAALPMVKGLEASDTEMDELATKAISSYDDLMGLGMNVDARYASDILAVASTMLGHAITAKTAKMNKKLKMIDLQLKKLALEQRSKDTVHTPVTTGQGQVLDRNQLLQKLLENGKSTQKE